MHGRGVIHNDTARNIFIPKTLIMPLQLQVAYNEHDIYFRYQWPTERPHVYLDMLRYTGGEWIRHGSSPVGEQPDGVYEDRVSMLVDDGGVPEFKRYGGYITVGENHRFMSREASATEVREHAYLGQQLGATDVRKSLPATRTDINDWRTVVDDAALTQQRQVGYFLDLWHWRAHRSNPLNVSDDEFVAEFRHSDSGIGPFYTNWDSGANHPSLMFNPAKTGFHALNWTEVTTGRPDFDAIYYLSESMALPFDNSLAWQEGDTLPRRVLRLPSGSRGDIRVDGQARWQDGYWRVTLVRAKDTGDPLQDKVFKEQGLYDIAIAVHRNAMGSRWHYVSIPLEMGLGRDAEIRAHKFSGSQPDWTQVDSHTLELFYPGQVNWTTLLSKQHAGAAHMRAGVPVRVRHSAKQLAYYGVEAEFLAEIKLQWLLTLFAGLLLIAAFALALNNLLSKQGER
ncbi:cytochrome C [Arsukibacterium ikkense]|uniref:Cytochrome C n=2 Tax=Arsukibacterium ikkense TaxID=336831 RepID=A0A0M2V2Y4_9GAMM|nr:cytochrome C [Arsukibacterium ikkense]